MENLEKKEAIQPLIKTFLIHFLLFTTLTPYLLIAMSSVIVLGVSFAFNFFSYIFGLAAFPLSLFLASLFLNKNLVTIKGLKLLIVKNSKKLFFIGIGIFYFVIVLFALIIPGAATLSFMFFYFLLWLCQRCLFC